MAVIITASHTTIELNENGLSSFRSSKQHRYILCVIEFVFPKEYLIVIVLGAVSRLFKTFISSLKYS
jgi:hypothetical protein